MEGVLEFADIVTGWVVLAGEEQRVLHGIRKLEIDG